VHASTKSKRMIEYSDDEAGSDEAFNENSTRNKVRNKHKTKKKTKTTK